jgi:hypothetical protein
MRPRNVIGPRTFTLGTAVVVLAVIRNRSLRWGATHDEQHLVLPGDELMARTDLQSTRAVTIRTSLDRVWPWLAQLGQGRGGLYSYDWLENLIGCNIHSADVVLPQHQQIAEGDQVRLAPQLALDVARVDPGTALVLRGGIPMGSTTPPFDFSWAFVLQEKADGSTRLLVRERYQYTRRWAALIVEPTELISRVMSTRMLRGIKQRAERRPITAPSTASVGAAT